jgi:hypothetical protein
MVECMICTVCQLFNTIMIHMLYLVMARSAYVDPESAEAMQSLDRELVALVHGGSIYNTTVSNSGTISNAINNGIFYQSELPQRRSWKSSLRRQRIINIDDNVGSNNIDSTTISANNALDVDKIIVEGLIKQLDALLTMEYESILSRSSNATSSITKDSMSLLVSNILSRDGSQGLLMRHGDLVEKLLYYSIYIREHGLSRSVIQYITSSASAGIANTTNTGSSAGRYIPVVLDLILHLQKRREFTMAVEIFLLVRPLLVSILDTTTNTATSSSTSNSVCNSTSITSTDALSLYVRGIAVQGLEVLSLLLLQRKSADSKLQHVDNLLYEYARSVCMLVDLYNTTISANVSGGISGSTVHKGIYYIILYYIIILYGE